MRILFGIIGAVLVIASIVTFIMGEWIIGLICGIVGILLLLVTCAVLAEAAIEAIFSIFD